VTTPFFAVERPRKNTVRLVLEIGGGFRYYVGRWDGARIVGRVSDDPSGAGEVATFEVSPKRQSDPYATPSSVATVASGESTVHNLTRPTRADASRCASIQPIPRPFSLRSRTKATTSACGTRGAWSIRA
jgi:hypothetical protein